MNFSTKLFSLLLISLMVACSGKEDTNSPVISNFTVDGLTAFDFIEVLAGNSLTVGALITEDIENASYRIQIVPDFTTISATPFSYDMEFTATELSVNVSEAIAIPASTVGGPYKVMITATDAADRSSDMEILVSINNPTQPVINMTPDPTIVHNYSPGDTIHLGGTITDGEDIVSINIVCEPRQETGGLTAAASPFYNGTINVNGAANMAYDLTDVVSIIDPIVIPTSQQPGSYKMVVTCVDSDENSAFAQVDFQVF